MRYFSEEHKERIRVAKTLPCETRTCACGCGGTFECKVNSKQKYINGHNRRNKTMPEEAKQRIGKATKAYWQDPVHTKMRLERFKSFIGIQNKLEKKLEETIDGILLAETLDNPAIKMLGILEPGKIYCLQVDMNGIDVDTYCELAKEGIRIAVIDHNANFVSIPKGYEVVKK